MRGGGSIHWTVLDSPVGDLGIGLDADAIRFVHFGGIPGSMPVAAPVPPAGPLPGSAGPLAAEAARQIAEYFAGARTQFDLPTRPLGGTGFERDVWAAISTIPYGHMATYGEIAAAVGDPGSARAVGVACNRNPLPVLVPCHRVVGAGGKLVGFGGGLDRKRQLLALEARLRVEREFSW